MYPLYLDDDYYWDYPLSDYDMGYDDGWEDGYAAGLRAGYRVCGFG